MKEAQNLIAGEKYVTERGNVFEFVTTRNTEFFFQPIGRRYSAVLTIDAAIRKGDQGLAGLACFGSIEGFTLHGLSEKYGHAKMIEKIQL